MFAATRNYFQTLVEAIGNGWNHFWYETRDGRSLIWLRQIVAVLAFWWLASFTPQLVSMFGEGGWVSLELVHATTTTGSLSKISPGFSPLFYASASGLWVCHALALVVVGSLAFGFKPRITTPLSLLVVLSYVHRAAMLCGCFEAVLCMLLLYLCIGKTKNWRFVSAPHWLNNISARLIQVHLCALYLLIATSKLGTPDWWSGMATWYLLTDTNHRLVNLESLAGNDNMMDAISHSWIAFELLFPVLIWVRVLRPALLGLALFVWLWTAMVTGQVGYCLLMASAHLAFVESRPNKS